MSWIRKRDGSLLTVDSDTFVGDARFQVIHPVNSNTWTLHIRGARGMDAGQYECQVSSEPKLSLVYNVYVIGILLIFISLFCQFLMLCIVFVQLRSTMQEPFNIFCLFSKIFMFVVVVVVVFSSAGGDTWSSGYLRNGWQRSSSSLRNIRTN